MPVFYVSEAPRRGDPPPTILREGSRVASRRPVQPAVSRAQPWEVSGTPHPARPSPAKTAVVVGSSRRPAAREGTVFGHKACGARNLPSIDYGRNTAWLHGRPSHLAHHPILSAPARLVTHTRHRILKIPPGWPWSTDLTNAWDRLQALHPV
jgi:hypothetical protein